MHAIQLVIPPERSYLDRAFERPNTGLVTRLSKLNEPILLGVRSRVHRNAPGPIRDHARAGPATAASAGASSNPATRAALAFARRPVDAKPSTTMQAPSPAMTQNTT